MSTTTAQFSAASARLLASKPPLAYAATPEHKATRHLLTLEHNGTRILLQLLAHCDLLHDAPPVTAEIQLDLSVLARMESAERLATQRRYLAAHAPTPFFADVLRDLTEFKERAFDQYAGLRQIGDLRGLPRCGAALFAAATPVVRQLSQLADAVVVLLMSHVYLLTTSSDAATQQRGIALMRDALAAGERSFAALCAEYEPCLAAIVASVGCLRSKHVTDERASGSGLSLNDLYQRRFIQAVIDATGAHERHMRDVLAAVLAEVDQCAEATRTRIYADLGGRPAVLERAEVALDGLRPWAVDWLKVQKDAFQMREVFAADIDSLHRVLDQSLQQMLLGFRECLTQGVVSVMIPLGEDLEKMRSLVVSHRKLSMGGEVK
jgi:hypothetical protein